MVNEPSHWLEPDVRWQRDDDRCEPDRRFVGRFWSVPGESTEVVITLEPTPDGGTDLTVTETRDRPVGTEARAQLLASR